MHLTYLPDAVRRGARIYGLCKVDRLLIEGRRVTGVVASILDEQRHATGQRLTVRARAVFLCAGAIHTPALLLRHGLGRGSRAVGRHLRIHPASGVTGKFEETVNGWQGVMQPFAIEEYVSEGILLEAVFPPLGMTYSSAALPGVGEEHAALLADYPHMASIGSVVSDTGSGRVRSVPGGSSIMLYRMSPRDVRRAVRAISLGARVLFAAGALEVYPGVPAVPVLRSLGEVDDFEKRSWTARHLKVAAFHPLGTARMGTDPAHSVCDPSGRVHDVENLYIGDTSLFPGSPHANPQFTLMALCRNLAHRFAEG
jgi:choline dehydrogenase-like flavoprotein